MSDVFQETQEVKVDDLVGEGKKFKTADDLAKGKVESDRFVEDLKRQINDMKTSMDNQDLAKTELEALKNEIKTLRERASQSRDNTSPALSESQLRALVESTVTNLEGTKTANQNVIEANTRLVKHFGTLEKAQVAVKTKASELGVSIDFLKEAAAKSPDAFVNILGITVTKPDQGLVVNNSVNTEAAGGSNNGQLKEGTKEYFDNVLKTKGRSHYFSTEVQQQIWKAVKAGTYQLN